MEKVAAKLAKEEEERLEREKLKQEEEKNFEVFLNIILSIIILCYILYVQKSN